MRPGAGGPGTAGPEPSAQDAGTGGVSALERLSARARLVVSGVAIAAATGGGVYAATWVTAEPAAVPGGPTAVRSDPFAELGLGEFFSAPQRPPAYPEHLPALPEVAVVSAHQDPQAQLVTVTLASRASYADLAVAVDAGFEAGGWEFTSVATATSFTAVGTLDVYQVAVRVDDRSPWDAPGGVRPDLDAGGLDVAGIDLRTVVVTFRTDPDAVPAAPQGTSDPQH